MSSKKSIDTLVKDILSKYLLTLSQKTRFHHPIKLLVLLGPSPIKIILPQVKNIELCKPINKSVIAKLTIKAGIYLIPNNAGI